MRSALNFILGYFWQVLLSMRKSEANRMIVWAGRNGVRFTSIRPWKERHSSMAKLISAAISLPGTPIRGTFIVNTGDSPKKPCYGLRNFDSVVMGTDFSVACPDFLFDSWSECGIDDFEQMRLELAEAGLALPSTAKLGWIGNVQAIKPRQRFVDLSRERSDLLEGIAMNWASNPRARERPGERGQISYLSLPEQVRRWRYLIDIEGRGYSARVKLLLFSRRPLFLVDRPCKEWYFEELVPWRHFVPVKRDLSDLFVNLSRLQNDGELEMAIATSGYEFACSRLTRERALDRWRTLLA